MRSLKGEEVSPCLDSPCESYEVPSIPLGVTRVEAKWGGTNELKISNLLQNRLRTQPIASINIEISYPRKVNPKGKVQVNKQGS